jgi:lysophospholipase L1-like esterase
MKNKLFLLMAFIAIMNFGCAKKDVLTENSTSSEAQKLDVNKSKLAVNLVAPGAINDPNISYFGRWDRTSSTTQYTSEWGGAYLKVKFTGTSVKLKVGATTDYFVKIDNGDWINFIGKTGTINLTPSPLSSGTHTLLVAQGKDYSYVFNFQGLILDAGATTSAPATGTDLIEYIGDSITAGYRDSIPGHGRANVLDYAWLSAESIGAEHTQIAYPGIALITGNGANASNKTGMESQYFKKQSLASSAPTDWNFSNYTPRIIVLNLGQNDGGSSDSIFQDHYVPFLAAVRTKFPNAEIFVMRTFSGTKAAPTAAAVNVRIAAGDNMIHYVDTNGWLTTGSSDFVPGDNVHPSASGQAKAAMLLAPILSPYLTGGTAPAPVLLDNCDVLTGWSSQNTLTLNTMDKKEGSAAMQSVGSGTLEFQKHFASVINSGATQANGSIRFWYYVSDITKFGASNQIELGSAGGADMSEYNWNMGTLVNGWNLITKTFSSAGSTGGVPNLNAINWFRIYHAKTGNVTTKVDNLQIWH